MRVTVFGSSGRARVRQVLSIVLRLVPMRSLSWLRHTFPATEPGSWRHSACGRLLELIRHRGIPLTDDVFTLVDNPKVCLVRADSFVVERVYWFGEKYGYEPEVLHWWLYFCRRSSRIVELGANVGYFAVQGGLAAPMVPYTAVEPHPGCAALCRRNLRANGLDQVHVVEAAAVGEPTPSTLRLLLPGGRDHYAEAPCTGFIGRNELHRDDWQDPSYGAVEVPTIPLVDLIDRTDLLKLDVEGQEYDLLSSVLEKVRSERPTMFLELPDSALNLRSLVLDLCEAAGYRCFRPTRQSLVPMSEFEITAGSVASRGGVRDVVLAPR